MSKQHKTAHRSHSAISDLTFTATAQPLGHRTKYRYDAFGNTLSSSGTLAAANVYRFSSKELHSAGGFYIYLYRFYDPSSQRWLNRDPLEEDGGVNLYRIVDNDPVNKWDFAGLMPDGPTVGETGAAECARLNIQCNRDCMKRPAPYPWGNYPPGKQRKAAKVRYCEEKCQAEYMDCMKEAEERAKKASQSFCLSAALAAAPFLGPILGPILGPVAGQPITAH